MTWPSSDVNTTNADASGDNPQNMRADLLDLMQKFNQLRNHVSTFVQGLLSAANAAAARTTLGAAILGTNNDITSLTALTPGGVPNNTILTANIAAAQVTQAKLETLVVPLGVGQTWQDMTASRALGTNYTNSSGRPISVHLWFVPSAGGSNGVALVAGTVVDTIQSATTEVVGAQFIVPSGAVYRFNNNSGLTLTKWMELRV